MAPPLDIRAPKQRRTLLRLIGASTGAAALDAALETGAADSDESIVVEQGDRCVELAPLQGDEPVSELYDYTYPTDRFDGPPGSEGSTFSSEGTIDLQRDRTSTLFLYDGPDGLSLVVVHGRLDGDRDAGGTVTFTFSGLSEEAAWIVRDDYYLEDGEQAGSNFDRWDVDDDVHVVDWAYRGGRTDGGAVRGLGSDFEVTIEPAFNDDATLATDHDYGPIEAWDILAGDRDEPDRFPLRLDLPVTIRTGACGEATGDEEAANDETEDDETADDATGDEGPTDDEQRGKHERKQQKHREKHQRKQAKHEKKRRKHRRKHERKQRKHRQKHRRNQRKHRKHDN